MALSIWGWKIEPFRPVLESTQTSHYNSYSVFVRLKLPPGPDFKHTHAHPPRITSQENGHYIDFMSRLPFVLSTTDELLHAARNQDPLFEASPLAQHGEGGPRRCLPTPGPTHTLCSGQPAGPSWQQAVPGIAIPGGIGPQSRPRWKTREASSILLHWP